MKENNVSVAALKPQSRVPKVKPKILSQAKCYCILEVSLNKAPNTPPLRQDAQQQQVVVTLGENESNCLSVISLQKSLRRSVNLLWIRRRVLIAVSVHSQRCTPVFLCARHTLAAVITPACCASACVCETGKTNSFYA